jgi:hypothetical protein
LSAEPYDGEQVRPILKIDRTVRKRIEHANTIRQAEASVVEKAQPDYLKPSHPISSQRASVTSVVLRARLRNFSSNGS